MVSHDPIKRPDANECLKRYMRLLHPAVRAAAGWRQYGARTLVAVGRGARAHSGAFVSSAAAAGGMLRVQLVGAYGRARRGCGRAPRPSDEGGADDGAKVEVDAGLKQEVERLRRENLELRNAPPTKVEKVEDEGAADGAVDDDTLDQIMAQHQFTNVNRRSLEEKIDARTLFEDTRSSNMSRHDSRGAPRPRASIGGRSGVP